MASKEPNDFALEPNQISIHDKERLLSQHIFETTDSQGNDLTVTMGYDRPLDFVFCTVMTRDDDIIYSNLDDDDAGTHQQDVGYYRSVLQELGLNVPESVFREVIADQFGRVGNRVVTHAVAK
jgi:hypothetical protein